MTSRESRFFASYQCATTSLKHLQNRLFLSMCHPHPPKVVAFNRKWLDTTGFFHVTQRAC